METPGEVIAFSQMVMISCMQSTFLVVKCVRAVRDGWRPTWGMFAYPFQGCCGEQSENIPEEHMDAPQSLLITRLAERRVELMEGFCTVWTRACGAFGTMTIIRFLLGLPMVGELVNNSLYTAIYLSAFLPQLFPELLKKHFTLWLHGWVQALIFCWGANLALWHKDLFVLWKTGNMLARATIGIAHPVQWLNAFWNVAWAGLGILARNDNLPLTTVFVDELLIAIFLIFVVLKFEEIQTAQIRSDIRASGYLRAKKTMERLLADMCDAVVELDPQLHIRQACPKLAGLLLRDAGNTALRGDPFAGLALTEEDRDRFSHFVAERAVPMAHEQNIENNRRSQSMFMNLRDSAGTPVAVQIFHSCHYDPFDQLCHVVGVHEVENNMGAARDTLGAGNWREGVERQPAARNRHAGNPGDNVSEAGEQGGQGVDSESVASSFASSVSESEASALSVHTVPVIPRGDAPEYTMVLDVMTNEIIATTTSFPSITGPLRFRAHLADFILDFDQFQDWLQREIHVEAEGQWSALDVKIVPVGSRNDAHFEFEAEVLLLDIHRGVLASQFGVEHLGDEEEHRFDLLVVLVFGKPVPKWRSKGIRRSRRSRRRRLMQPQPQTRNQFYEIAL